MARHEVHAPRAGPHLQPEPPVRLHAHRHIEAAVRRVEGGEVVLAGAALLYYLYKKHQAAQQAAGGTQGNSVQPQLYRSVNGGVYYRDPQNPQKVTWLTAPGQPVSVPAGDVQKYAPDYQQYQGQPAPAPPAGAAQQSFSQYDPSTAQ